MVKNAEDGLAMLDSVDHYAMDDVYLYVSFFAENFIPSLIFSEFLIFSSELFFNYQCWVFSYFLKHWPVL